jgi:hypothetical protein
MKNYKGIFNSILGTIVDAFNKKDISFCLLRNSDISWVNGDDIDVLLNHLDLESAVSEINTIINTISSASIIFDKQVDFHRHLFISFYDDLAHENRMLVIDFQTRIIENETVFFLADEVLKYKQETGSIPRLDSCMEAVLILIHSIFGKRKFNRNYWNILVGVNTDNSEGLFKILELVFKETVALQIIESLKNNNQLSVLSINQADLSPHIISENRSRFFERLYKRIGWILSPPGKLICFEGSVDINIKKELLSVIKLSPYESYIFSRELDGKKDVNNEIYKKSSFLKNAFSKVKSLYNSTKYYLRIRNRLSKNEVVIIDNYLSDNLLLNDMINNQKLPFLDRKISNFISLVVLFDGDNLLRNKKQDRYIELGSGYCKKRIIHRMLSRIF